MSVKRFLIQSSNTWAAPSTKYGVAAEDYDALSKRLEEAVGTVTAYYDRIRDLEAVRESARLVIDAEVARCPICDGSGKVTTWDMHGGPPLAKCPRCAPLKAFLKARP